MVSRLLQLGLVKAILQSSHLDSDHAVKVLRIIYPEIARLISSEEQKFKIEQEQKEQKE